MLGGLGASFLASFDILIVITALPSAARDVGGIHQFALAVGAYSVSVVAALPIGGSLSDRFGPFRTLVTGGGVFVVGTVVAGSAVSMDQIAAGRLLMGFGGGFLLSVPPVLWALYLPDRLQGVAFGLNAAVWGISAVLGPPAGSVLTATLGWRWVFWINLPLLALMVTLAVIGLRGQAPRRHVEHPVNLIGPFLLGLIVLCLLTVQVAAIVPLVLFALTERRAANPILPRHRSGIAVCAIAFATGVSFIGAEGFLTLDLQAGIGWSVFAASVPLILSTIAWTVGSVAAARLDWTLRRFVAVGAAIVAVCSLTMALPGLGGWAVAIGYSLSGFGMGLSSPALFGAVLSDDGGSEGRESAAVPTARNIGGGIGVALGGAVLLHASSAATLRAAEHGTSPLPSLHSAARLAFLLVACVTIASLPAARAIRLRRRGAAPA